MSPIVVTSTDPLAALAERLLVVSLDEQNQLVPLLDLEERDVLWKLAGTFTITPGARQATMAAGEARRSGAIQIAERRDLGTVGASWMAKGATADTALARVEALLTEADSAARRRFVYWKPAGASYAALYPIIGPATAQAVPYRWGPFTEGLVQVDVSWPVDPMVWELPLDLLDDFRGRDFDGTTDMSAYQHADTWTFATATHHDVRLPTTGAVANTGKVWCQDRRPVSDMQVTIRGQWLSGASGSFAVCPGLRYGTDNSYMFAALVGSTLWLYSVIAGTQTQRSSAAVTAPLVGTDYWIRIRSQGDFVRASFWTTQPNPHGTADATTGNHDASAYGMGATRVGWPMLQGWGMASGSGNKLVDWKVEPYTYSLVNTPAVVELPQIPGSAPALADIDLTTATSDPTYPRHVILGWRRNLPGRETTGSPNTGVSMRLNGETYNNAVGPVTTATDAALYRGPSGQAARITVTNADASASLDYRIDPTIFDPDDFDSDVTVAIFARYARATGIVVPRMRVELRNVLDVLLDRAYAPEHGATGRYLPTQGSGMRTASLGTLRLPIDPAEGVDLRVTVFWSAGTTNGVFLHIDELYVIPLTGMALGATGKNRDDTAYAPLMPANGITRRIKTNLAGELASWALYAVGRRYPVPANIGGVPIELPTGEEGVELLVRPSVGVPDDPTSTTADGLAHNTTVHVAVTPRHHLLPG